MTAQTPATAEMELTPGPVFHIFLTPGPKEKLQDPAGVDSGNPDPVPPLPESRSTSNAVPHACGIMVTSPSPRAYLVGL